MSLRTVIEEPRFTQDIDMYRRNYPLMDVIHEEITNELAEDPRSGEPLELSPDFRFHKTLPRSNTPQFVIMYSFDTEHVYLHSITRVE